MNKYVNLGCGQRFQSGWTNIDYTSSAAGVMGHDLSKGIPLPDESSQLVYLSHLLEHFPRKDAGVFLKECHRVLEAGGIIRVVVPDLEAIAQTYLEALNKAAAGESNWDAHYEWMMIEMYDQAVRNNGGGLMAEYLRQKDIANEEFVFKRCGFEARKLRQAARRDTSVDDGSDVKTRSQTESFVHKISDRIKLIPLSLRELLLIKLLGKEYHALNIGRFRLSGEIHQWMYDRYSLRYLLGSCGFVKITQRSAFESYLPDWTSQNLDTDPDGTVYKPDSLYMEAIKP